jgi:hypothetical protein
MSNARNLSDLLGTGTTITTANLADNAVTSDKLATNVAAGRKNLVMNGAMKIHQRGDKTGVTTSPIYGLDRWTTNGSGFGTVSLKQVTDVPSGQGFANAQEVKVTTARTTSATSDHLIIGTRFEGQDLQMIKKGTSNAEKLTLSFWAKANAATTITAELFDNDNARHVSKTFSITTSYQRFVYTFPADTTDAFDDDHNLSLYLFFWLSSDTDFTSGTLSETWIDQDNTKRVDTGGTTFMGTLNSSFTFTGVQLEIGEVSSPVFEHVPYGEELNLCKRYYEEIYNPSFQGTQTGGLRAQRFTTNFFVEKRHFPTVSLSGYINYYDGNTVGNLTSSEINSAWIMKTSYEIDSTDTAGAAVRSAETSYIGSTNVTNGTLHVSADL